MRSTYTSLGIIYLLIIFAFTLFYPLLLGLLFLLFFPFLPIAWNNLRFASLSLLRLAWSAMVYISSVVLACQALASRNILYFLIAGIIDFWD